MPRQSCLLIYCGLANVPAIMALRPDRVEQRSEKQRSAEIADREGKKVEPDAFAGHLGEMRKDEAVGEEAEM
jgi:hypothetical protein